MYPVHIPVLRVRAVKRGYTRENWYHQVASSFLLIEQTLTKCCQPEEVKKHQMRLPHQEFDHAVKKTENGGNG